MTRGRHLQVLAQRPVTRWVSLSVGAPAYLFAWPLLSGREGGTPDLIAGAFFAALGATMSIRGYRLGVVLDDDTMLVRGLCRSRRIPAGAIDKITDYPVVHWRASGRSRRTPVMAFKTPTRSAAFVLRHNRDALGTMRNWLAESKAAHLDQRH